MDDATITPRSVSENQAEGPSSGQGPVARVRAQRPAGSALRRQWALSVRPAEPGPELGPAPCHPWPAARLRLGSVELVSLAEAREKARSNRNLAREGGDPLAKRRRAHGIPSFAEAAAKVVEPKRAGWRSPRQADQWMASLSHYAFPRIGRVAVSEMTSADVLEILVPIWHVKAVTARRVCQRIRAVLEWAVAMELRTDNPCDRVGPVLGPQDAVVPHMRALTHREVASALQTVWASDAMPVAKLAFEFLVLTAARWGEVRWAEWAETDPTGGVWTIPSRRMKAKREHRVPCAIALRKSSTRRGRWTREPVG